MKTKIASLIPSSIKQKRRNILFYIRAFRANVYDLNKYFNYSSTNGLNTEKGLISKIIMEYHALEKGMTMPDIRYGFGMNRVNGLINLSKRYASKYNSSHPQYVNGVGVLIEYLKVHKENKITIPKKIEEGILNLEVETTFSSTIQINKSKEDYFKLNNSNFIEFANSRHSLRNYTKEDVDLELMKKAIDFTKNTPSVCNRQSVFCHVFTDKNQIASILKVQGGNRGFGHLTNKLIVITSDLNTFFGEGERNQAFIDGGMVAMNLLYSLHYHQLGACILNCSNSVAKDKNMRKVTGVKESHVFIAMISCGHVPDNFLIAASKKDTLKYRLNIDGNEI